MNNISGIDVFRTNQNAFSTQHAFVNFFDKLTFLPPSDELNHLSEIKIGKPVGTACCGTGSATDAKRNSWFHSFQIIKECPIVFIIIDLPVFLYLISKIKHSVCVELYPC